MEEKLRVKILIIAMLFLGLSLSSCLSYKQIVNFQDGEVLDSGYVEVINNFQPLKIQYDDVLQINVSSFEASEAQRFNLNFMAMGGNVGAGTGVGGIGVAEPLGYRVDSKGFIEMPVIGDVYVKDLTLDEARKTISQKIEATGYLKEFSLQIRYASFRFTVLGEVNRPGTYTVPNSKITVLEAVGLAGDVSIFSNRDNILLIREEEGIRQYGRINLKTKDVFKSPYYYLKSNDIIYVEPHKSRILSTPDPVTRYIGTIVTFATLITLLITLFNNN